MITKGRFNQSIKSILDQYNEDRLIAKRSKFIVKSLGFPEMYEVKINKRKEAQN